jgi:Ca2+-binding RTX toxin-like protein
MAITKIKGTPGKDMLKGGSGPDVILALAGNDKLYGFGGSDRLDGGDGNDYLDGGLGSDTMIGGAGNDIFLVGQPSDNVIEKAGGGTDLVIASISWTLSQQIENLRLDGTSNLDATGNGLDNLLTGNAGDNHLDGMGGADKLVGKAGDDIYVFDNAGDRAVETANQGTDTIISSVDLTLADNVENLTLSGTADLSGTGNGLKNVLIGNAGNNALDGGQGVDWMLGGLGNDSYAVDNAADKITELADEGTDTVSASVSYILSANIENLTLSGGSAINGTGNAIANVLTGNSAANKLYADNIVGDSTGGSDQLFGNGGNDTLYSGDGSNTLDGGDGTGDIADYSLFSAAVTVSFDSFTAEVTKSGGGSDTLVNIEGARGSMAADVFNISYAGSFYGGGGNDSMADAADGDAVHGKLYGEGGDDTLSAGADGGRLDGGADNDTLIAASTASATILMTGGSGSDQFDLGANFNGSGGSAPDGTLAATVEVTDFTDGTDKLLFHAFGNVDTAQEWYDLLAANNTIEDETDGLHIGADSGTGQALIQGLSVATFSVDDIVVV